MASYLCFDATFYIPKAQSFFNVGSNVERKIQNNILVFIPWLYENQSKARYLKKGLWEDQNPLEPWNWRKLKN